MKKRVFITIGTRPEAIKMAPLYKEMQGRPDFEPLLISTGQHDEMLRQVLDWFEIKADEDLKVMTPNQTVSQVLSKSLTGLDRLISLHEPDIVLAQGDTTTVLAAALAAFNRRVPFGHVEAGLRTYDLERPFPEEGYRQMASRIARWHFAPTQRASDALQAENLSGEIYIVGNTVIDALLMTAAKADKIPVDIGAGPMVLITGHRRENHDRFRRVFETLAELARKYPGTAFVYPVHLNPKVKDLAHEILADTANFHLIAPVNYPDIVALMKRAILIITDSGGIQEEAPSLNTPLLVMRETTERPESVDIGAAKLVGTDPEVLLTEASKLLSSDKERASMMAAENPYGDGRSSARICDILSQSAL